MIRPRNAGCAAPAVLALVLATGLTALAGALPARAQTSERIVIDELRGLAIGGFDPLAYFANGAPALGREEFEYRFAGAVWRFVNEGNRAAFIAHPDIYAPAFGGYDPVSIDAGHATAGNPMIWAIIAQRLYFFYDEEARRAFSTNAAAMLKRAQYGWPAIAATLVP